MDGIEARSKVRNDWVWDLLGHVRIFWINKPLDLNGAFIGQRAVINVVVSFVVPIPICPTSVSSPLWIAIFFTTKGISLHLHCTKHLIQCGPHCSDAPSSTHINCIVITGW